ncbi:MAG: hypothetical protein Kilf2KO_40150 [Rhodospirillales bacterium]
MVRLGRTVGHQQKHAVDGVHRGTKTLGIVEIRDDSLCPFGQSPGSFSAAGDHPDIGPPHEKVFDETLSDRSGPTEDEDGHAPKPLGSVA